MSSAFWAACLGVSALGAPADPAAEWPGWRGADGSGVSRSAGLPATLSPGDAVRWQAAIPGRGVSSPVVAGGRVFITSASGPTNARLHVLGYEAKTGKKLWERQLWATGQTACHPKTSMAGPTPATDGAHVYALFATCDLGAYAVDGTLRWYRSLALDNPDISNQVGMATSPILWRDLLIVVLETDAHSLAMAIDTATGKDRWKVAREKGQHWTTPIVAAVTAKETLFLQSPRGLSAYDPATGEALWSLAAKLDGIASPVAAAGTVYAPGGETLAIEPPAAAGAEAKVRWRSSKLRTSTASLLCYEGRVYGISGAGILTCADAESGEEKWKARAQGPFSASPVAADGKIYLVNEEGVITIVDTRGEKQVLGTCALGETVLASPAIADGAIFIRTDKQLLRIGG